jgi:hypothetical protein
MMVQLIFSAQAESAQHRVNSLCAVCHDCGANYDRNFKQRIRTLNGNHAHQPGKTASWARSKLGLGAFRINPKKLQQTKSNNTASESQQAHMLLCQQRRTFFIQLRH